VPRGQEDRELWHLTTRPVALDMWVAARELELNLELKIDSDWSENGGIVVPRPWLNPVT